MPRRPSLSADQQAAIVDHVRRGVPARDAALAAGTTEATFYRWLQKGREAGAQPYRGFLEAIERARAEHKATLLARVEAASLDSWQAAAWYLERVYWRQFGRKERLQVDIPQLTSLLVERVGQLIDQEVRSEAGRRRVRRGLVEVLEELGTARN